jgi:hypothetical protein
MNVPDVPFIVYHFPWLVKGASALYVVRRAWRGVTGRGRSVYSTPRLVRHGEAVL